MNELLRLLLTIFGSALGSGLTVWLGFRQFRVQPWWDKKAECYLSIIEAFHPLLDEDGEYWEATYRGGEVPQEKRTALRAAANVAIMEIKKRQRLGRFLISDRAEAALEKMERNINSASHVGD